MDLQKIYTGALYDCCQLTAEQLIGGITHPDGRHDQLPPEDVIKCIYAQHELTKRNYWLMNMIAGRMSRCRAKAKCDSVPEKYFVAVREDIEEIIFHNPLSPVG